MITTGENIALLIRKYLDDELTAGEHIELNTWLQSDPLNPPFFEYITNPEGFYYNLRDYEDVDINSIRLKIAKEFPLIDQPDDSRAAHRVHFLKTVWFRYAAAIIIIFGIGAYLWNNRTKPEKLQTAKTNPVKEIQPGGQHALLTLADGSTIELDSAANGQLTTQGNSKIIKQKDGQLIYDDARHPGATKENPGSLSPEVFYNTMSTPRGGQYQLTLSDGTNVWLNAASSITYPTIFNSKTREVKVIGEVYFEIARNKSKPFIVKTITDQITVLGTSFNVNYYSDEPKGKISLIDGSVKVNEVLLQPGQAYSSGKVVRTNIQQDVAWKNGYFNLEDITLEQAMRQFARWYDVEIIYEKGIPKGELSGRMDRHISLQDALSGLEGVVGHFRLVGRKVYISPLK